MERIKHHFCWVKTVDGAAKTARPASGITTANLLVAWSSGAEGVAAPSGVERFIAGGITPQHGGVPPPKSLSKALAQPATAAMLPATASSPRTESVAGSSDPASGAGDDKHGGVPPPGPAAASSAKSLVPPPPPVFDPELSVKHGPVPPSQRRLVFAGASMAGAWAFDHLRLTGAPDGEDLRHEFQVVLGDESDALAWLDSSSGQEWLLDAKAVSLITFAVIGTF